MRYCDSHDQSEAKEMLAPKSDLSEGLASVKVWVATLLLAQAALVVTSQNLFGGS